MTCLSKFFYIFIASITGLVAFDKAFVADGLIHEELQTLEQTLHFY